MRTIHKCELKDALTQVIKIPNGFKILCLQIQRDTPYLWCEVDTLNEIVDVNLVSIGTGDTLPTDNLEYIGTYQRFGGNLVIHVYIN